MDYFASAFQGRLIDHLDEASRAGDDECVISDYLRLTGEALGACGTRAECHQHAPIAHQQIHGTGKMLAGNRTETMVRARSMAEVRNHV